VAVLKGLYVNSVTEIIAKETKGRSLKTFKHGFDNIDFYGFDYNDNKKIWGEKRRTVLIFHLCIKT